MNNRLTRIIAGLLMTAQLGLVASCNRPDVYVQEPAETTEAVTAVTEAETIEETTIEETTVALTDAPSEAPETEAPTNVPETEAVTEAPTPELTAAPTQAPQPEPTATPTQAPQPEPTAVPTQAPQTAAPTEAPVTAAPTEAPATAAPTEAPQPDPTAAPTNPPAQPGNQVAASPPKSAAKDPSYFADALFIGGSRIQGLMLYGTLFDAHYLVNKGYDVGDYSRQTIKTETGDQTGAQYVSSQANVFNDVYIGFGINETGWPLSGFINTYRGVVQHVKANQANASIYVMAILPTTTGMDSNQYSNNRMIRKFNEAIDKMAAEEGVYFLDATSVVAGPDGALPKSASTDGVHFDRATVMKWQEFLQTHVAP